MKNRKSGSREYKLLLDTKMFSVGPEQFAECTSRYWCDFCGIAGSLGIPVDGALEVVLSQRFIRFHDTKENRLHRNGYLFRERIDLISGDREVTLKFRHPDRYLAQDRSIEVKQTKDGQEKFEQDIKVPFLTLFSYSSKQRIDHVKNLNRMDDLGRLFPDLPLALDEYKSREKLELVNEFTAQEVVLGGAHLLLGKKQNILTECALIFWYNMAVGKDSPVLVEFSYRYKDKKERYSGYVSQQAYDVFLRLQRLDDWIDSSFLSKTEYVFSLDCASQ